MPGQRDLTLQSQNWSKLLGKLFRLHMVPPSPKLLVRPGRLEKKRKETPITMSPVQVYYTVSPGER